MHLWPGAAAGVRVTKGEAKKGAWMVLELEEIREYDTVKMPERFVSVGE